MRCFKMSCLTTIGLLALSVLVWAIGGGTTARAEEGTARQAAKQPTTQAAKQLDGISKLLLVRGKSRTETLQMALGSGAKEVLIALQIIDTETDPENPVPVGIVEYHIINGRVVETELRIRLSQSEARKSIQGIYDEVKAAGKIDRTKTTKYKVFLTVPLDNKRVLNVEMQEPSAMGIYPWFVRFRPGDSAAKTNAGRSTVIAGIRIPVSVSTTEQLKAFLKPQWELLLGIELLDVSIPFGQGKVVRSERVSYAIAAGDEAKAETEEAEGTWGVRPGFLGKVECWICEKGQDYKTLMALVNDIRRRGRLGNVVLSKNNIFIANVTMPTTGVEGKVSASFAISNTGLRAQIKRIPDAEDLFARIKIDVGPRNKDRDTPTTKPAEEKSDK